MEELIKAKDEQIAKLNNLKDLLKQQILSLQEENTKLKNELFEIEEKIKQLPKDVTHTPDYQSMFNAINAKLTSIVEKLDVISVEGLVTSSSEPTPKSKSKSKPKAVNEADIKKAEPHPAEMGLLKPSSLFDDSDSTPEPQAQQQKAPAPQSAPVASFHAADPRSLHRTVQEIPYPENGVIQCPKCNKMEFQEMPEPARGSFAKKYYCKKCRAEWRFLY